MMKLRSVGIFSLGLFPILLIAVTIFTNACGNSSPTSSGSSNNPTSNGYTVTTLAGQAGISGWANGTGTAASFNTPLGVAVDASGNVYVADDSNSLIREITSGGVVTTLAGNGSGIFVSGGVTTVVTYNGPITSVQFENVYGDSPEAVAVDSSGNVYLAGQDTILNINIASGNVALLAGSGSAGFANATGAAAMFNGIDGVAVDASGNVYVADTYNQLIRKITSGGVVTTLAGQVGVAGSANGTGTGASFDNPYGVAVDSSGNVYVTDSNWIRKITSGGVVTTLAGSVGGGFANGTGTAASFSIPHGIAVDSSGNVYVADEGNHLIREITAGGVVTTLAGSGANGSANGPALSASFDVPNGIAVDSSGNVYVADSGNNLIRKISTSGAVAPTPTSGPALTPTPNPASIVQVTVTNNYGYTIYMSMDGGTSTPITGSGTYTFTSTVAGIHTFAMQSGGPCLIASPASCTSTSLSLGSQYAINVTTTTAASTTCVGGQLTLHWSCP